MTTVRKNRRSVGATTNPIVIAKSGHGRLGSRGRSSSSSFSAAAAPVLLLAAFAFAARTGSAKAADAEDLTAAAGSDTDGRRGRGISRGLMCPSDDAGVDNLFSGVTINVLGRSFGHDYFMEKVSEWEALTGAKVNVPVAAKSGGELNQLTWEDMSTGANFYDAYIATNQNVPSLAHNVDPNTGEPWILNMDKLVKDSEKLDWPGIHGTFRENICLYDDHIYTLPFDGDQYFLYYRRDLQERDGWDVPKTWDDLVRIAEMYDGQDLNGDGVPDYAMCQPNQEGMNSVAMYTIMAPLLGLLQTHPETHADVRGRIYPKRSGAYFELGEDGLAPLVDNAAVRRVLPFLRRVYELGRSEEINLCCGTKDEGSEINSGHGLFRTGRCAFYYSFPSVGTNTVRTRTVQKGNETETAFEYQHGRTGTAELPGWTEYLDREADVLVPCTAEECPAAVPLDDSPGGNSDRSNGNSKGTRWLNRASFFANGGMGGVINGRVSELRRLAAFNLFSYFSRTLETTRAGMPYNPFRDPDHFKLEDYTSAGWDGTDARLYLDAARRSLDNSNVGTDLRVPYAVRGLGDKRGFVRAYARRFFEYYNKTATSDDDNDAAVEETIAALDGDIREWVSDHDTRVASSDTYWTGQIEEVYRRSMNLPLRPGPVNETYHSIEKIRWFGWTLGAVVILSSLFLGGWVYRERKCRIVRASQPIFLSMIVIGAAVMGGSLFPLGIDDTIASKEGCDVACVAFPWFFACGFTVSFAALVSKQLRINKLFHNPRFKRIKVSARDVMVPFAVLFALNFVLLLSWTLVDPPQWTVVQVDPLNSYGRCDTSGGTASTTLLVLIGVVNLSALVTTNVQAYRARSISDEFAESKYIGIANLVILELVIFSLPVAFLVSGNPSARYFVFSSIIFVISMSLILLIFVPKILLRRRARDGEKLSMSTSTISGVSGLGRTSSTSESSVTNSVNLRASTGYDGIRVTRVIDKKKLKDVAKAAKREQHSHEIKLVALMLELTEMGIDAEEIFERVGIDVPAHGPHAAEGGVQEKKVSWKGDIDGYHMPEANLFDEPVADASANASSIAAGSSSGDKPFSPTTDGVMDSDVGDSEPLSNGSESASNLEDGVDDFHDNEGVVNA